MALGQAFFAALVAAAALAAAKDTSRSYGAVVCSSEASGPWTLRAQGTLTRTKSEGELAYRFESGEHSFDWRLVTSPQGHTTALGPGFLMERFPAVSKRPQSPLEAPRGPGNAAATITALPERRQSIQATGEIREYDGPDVLVLIIGANCPGARRP